MQCVLSMVPAGDGVMWMVNDMQSLSQSLFSVDCCYTGVQVGFVYTHVAHGRSHTAPTPGRDRSRFTLYNTQGL